MAQNAPFVALLATGSSCDKKIATEMGCGTFFYHGSSGNFVLPQILPKLLGSFAPLPGRSPRVAPVLSAINEAVVAEALEGYDQRRPQEGKPKPKRDQKSHTAPEGHFKLNEIAEGKTGPQFLFDRLNSFRS